MVRRDARVSSFIMHTCVWVFCFFYFNSNSFCPVFATHAVFKWVFESIVLFATWACVLVCVRVGFPFLFHASFFKCLIIFYSKLRCIFKAIRNETAKQRRKRRIWRAYQNKRTPIQVACDTGTSLMKKVRVMELQKTKLFAKKMRTAEMSKMQAAISFILTLACVIRI